MSEPTIEYTSSNFDAVDRQIEEIAKRERSISNKIQIRNLRRLVYLVGGIIICFGILMILLAIAFSIAFPRKEVIPTKPIPIEVTVKNDPLPVNVNVKNEPLPVNVNVTNESNVSKNNDQENINKPSVKMFGNNNVDSKDNEETLKLEKQIDDMSSENSQLKEKLNKETNKINTNPEVQKQIRELIDDKDNEIQNLKERLKKLKNNQSEKIEELGDRKVVTFISKTTTNPRFDEVMTGWNWDNYKAKAPTDKFCYTRNFEDTRIVLARIYSAKGKIISLYNSSRANKVEITFNEWKELEKYCSWN